MVTRTLATPTGAPWSTLLSAPPVYQAKFAGLLRRSAPTPCPSISSRRLRSLVSLLIYVPPNGIACQHAQASPSLVSTSACQSSSLVADRSQADAWFAVGRYCWKSV